MKYNILTIDIVLDAFMAIALYFVLSNSMRMCILQYIDTVKCDLKILFIILYTTIPILNFTSLYSENSLNGYLPIVDKMSTTKSVRGGT